MRHIVPWIFLISLLIPSISLAAPPPNDNFADAIQLVGESGMVMGTNVEATGEPGEPTQSNVIPEDLNSIWYTWTAPRDGVFNVDTCGSGFAPWIEQLANDNITGGCGGGNYCPNNPVTRAQMAIFMVKAFNFGFVPD